MEAKRKEELKLKPASQSVDASMKTVEMKRQPVKKKRFSPSKEEPTTHKSSKALAKKEKRAKKVACYFHSINISNFNLSLIRT